MSERAPTMPMSARRPALLAHAALYLAALAVLAGVLNYFAQRPWLRARIDATKTRAYSLSEQTRSLLAGLAGEWTIGLVMVEAETDRAVGRQIDEVLTRFTRASEKVSVVRLDPTDPASLREFEGLMGRLRANYAGLIGEYDAALDDAGGTFRELLVFAQQQAGPLTAAVGGLAETSPTREGLARRAQLLALIGAQGQAVLDEVDRARRVDEGRPLPDWDTARSILAGGLAEWAQELFDISRLFEQALDDAGTPAELRRYMTERGPLFERTAEALAAAADPLTRLPPMELSAIGRELSRGETAIVMGPDRAAVIPSVQLIPRVATGAGDGVAFDQRFRGEQLIASSIRSLLVDRMPMVVFMHAETRSLRRADERDVDLVGVVSMLEASRFDVREWNVTDGPRPAPAPGQAAVWVVVPPVARQSLEPAPAEAALLGAVRGLIDEGEPVLLSVYPSLTHKFRRPDPWMALARPFGLRPDTSRVVFETVRVGEEETRIERGQAFSRYPSTHPITAALQGQQTYFALPLPVEAIEGGPSGVRRDVLAEILPGPDRWLEPDWSSRGEPTGERTPLATPLPVAVAAERTHPTARRAQRCIVVGSGGWMMSFVSDMAVNVGGERFALVNPGNHELMLSSVAWLAGMDELIARSPAGQEVARLEGVTKGARTRWTALSIGVVPGACLLMGLGVWWRRRT